MSSVLSLKPCPFCGAGSGYVKMGDSPMPEFLGQSFQFVMCWDCRAVGPIRTSIDDAIVAWNKRAEAAPITRTAAPECSTCAFFKHHVANLLLEGPHNGNCHRYPTPYVRSSSYWCGEWKEGQK